MIHVNQVLLWRVCVLFVHVETVLRMAPFITKYKRQSQQSATVSALELSDIGSHVGNYCVAPYWLIGILTRGHLNTGIVC